MPTYDPMSDERFIEQLYDKYHRLIFYTVKKYDLIGEPYEDIVQDCLVKLTEKVETLRALSEPALVSYIMATAKNTTMNCVRRQSRKQKNIICYEDVIDDLTAREAPDSSLDDVLIRLEDREQIRAIWPRLDTASKRILEAKYYLEYDDRELAQIWGIKPNSVRMRLTRARRKLLELLMEGEGHDETRKIDRRL